MAVLREITDLKAPELAPYTDTSELNLLREGVFVAESPKVIRTALDAGYEAVSLPCLRERAFMYIFSCILLMPKFRRV